MAMVISNVGAVADLPVFDIRNGQASDAVSLISKAAIPAAYKWVPIRELPPKLAMKYMDLFIKSALYNFTVNTPANASVDQIRKYAIAIGTARATMTAYWSLRTEDLIPGETATHALTYVAATGANGDPTWQVDAGVAENNRNLLLNDLALTDTERAAMCDIVRCTVGLPAVQGASLIATGHHYLSDVKEKSRALYDVIERQFWKGIHMDTFIGEDKEALRDVLWHKACHPVQMSVKYLAAVDPKVPMMLRQAQSGSMASRLPAKEGSLKAAETVITLLTNIRPFAEQYNGRTDMSILTDAVALTLCYVPSHLVGEGSSAIVGNALPDEIRGDRIPPAYNTREKCLALVEDIVSRNADTIAMAFGFFEAFVDSPIMGDTDKADLTLTKANSLRKYKNECFPSYGMGRQSFGDYMAWKKKEREAGRYVPLNLSLV